MNAKPLSALPPVWMARQLVLKKVDREKISWDSGIRQCDTRAVDFDGRGHGFRVDGHAMDVQPLPVLGDDVSLVARRKGVVVDDRDDLRGSSQNGFQGQIAQRRAATLFGGFALMEPRGIGEKRVESL